MKHFIKLKHNNTTSPVNTGTNNYKGTYPLSRQTQPTHAEQIETAKRNTGTHRTTKDRNSLNWKNQTKAIKPGSEFGDSRDEQDQFYPLSVSQIL